MNNKLTVFISICFMLVVLSGCGNGILNSANEIYKPSSGVSAHESTLAATTESTSEQLSSVKETVSQKNAVRAAKSYLEFGAFSRQGLIGQLEFEGYSNADAVYGVDHSGADWHEQAVKSAKSYLEFTAFSRQGLIDQLVFEGFTNEQAVYGVDATGL